MFVYSDIALVFFNLYIVQIQHIQCKTYINTHNTHTYTHSTWMNDHIDNTCIHTRVPTHTHVYPHTRTHTHTRVPTHTHTHTHAHTCTHTHAHTSVRPIHLHRLYIYIYKEYSEHLMESLLGEKIKQFHILKCSSFVYLPKFQSKKNQAANLILAIKI